MMKRVALLMLAMAAVSVTSKQIACGATPLYTVTPILSNRGNY